MSRQYNVETVQRFLHSLNSFHTLDDVAERMGWTVPHTRAVIQGKRRATLKFNDFLLDNMSEQARDEWTARTRPVYEEHYLGYKEIV